MTECGHEVFSSFRPPCRRPASRRRAGRPEYRLLRDPRRPGGRRNGRAAGFRRRARGGGSHRRGRAARAARRGTRRQGRRARSRARVHRRPQSFERGSCDRSPGRDPGLAGHHDARPRAGRRLALADRRLSRRAGKGAGGRQRDDDGRPRDGPQPRDGQGLPAQGHGRGNREDGRPRHAGNEGGRQRPFLRPRVRRRQLRLDRRADRARKGGRRARRLLHDAQPGRGGQELRGDRRGDRDLGPREPAARHLAHKARHGRRVGTVEEGRRPHRRRAREGTGRHGGLLSLRGVALEHRGPRAGQAVLRPEERRARPSPTSAARLGSPSRRARRIRATPAATSRRSPAPRASRRPSSSRRSSRTAARTSSATP